MSEARYKKPMNITYTIIGLTVLISLLAMNRERMMQNLMMNPYRIKRNREYYRFLTSGFIHINHVHLLFNMFSFYVFGTVIERIFSIIFGAAGGFYFIALYLLAIIVSDVPTYFRQMDNPQYNSLGASGGVSSVIFAFIVFEPLQLICFFIVVCMPGFIMGILFIAISYYQGRKSNSTINHEAHLYGALFGLFFCIIAYPASIGKFFEQIRNWGFLN
jgi:membrane associated rhomboid family serine protease